MTSEKFKDFGDKSAIKARTNNGKEQILFSTLLPLYELFFNAKSDIECRTRFFKKNKTFY